MTFPLNKRPSRTIIVIVAWIKQTIHPLWVFVRAERTWHIHMACDGGSFHVLYFTPLILLIPKQIDAINFTLLFVASCLNEAKLLTTELWRNELSFSSVLSSLTRSHALIRESRTVERRIRSDLLKWSTKFFRSRTFRWFVLHECHASQRHSAKRKKCAFWCIFNDMAN